MKTLLFLSDFWQKAKTAVEDICTELPKVQNEDILKPIGNSGKIWTIQFKDLGNSWSPEDHLMRNNGESKNLVLLTEKVKSVFEKSPDKVTDFLKATAEKGSFLIKGPLPGCESKTVKLTPNEISRLRLYVSKNI